MEDHRIKAFCLVVELKSFSKAAEAKHITQSAISQIIRSLEKELRVKLLNRDDKDITLTPAGRIFYQHAKTLLADYRRIETDMSELGGQMHGQLSIAAIPTLATQFLPAIIREFSLEHPNVEFSITLGTSEEAVLAMHQEFCNLCFFEGSLQKLPLGAKKFARDEMVFVVAADNKLAGKAHVNAADLKKAFFVMPEVGTSIRTLTDKHIAALGLSSGQIRISVIVTDPIVRVLMAAAGMGVAFVSTWSAIQQLRAGNLVILKTGRKPHVRDYYWATPDGVMSPLVERFVRAVERSGAEIGTPESDSHLHDRK
ncbi:MAG TPA: LysR family transcriptional regulator [Dissulfurispiraceae bacterium]|nr:LysR family transcriptional regulator [Dissulfurispiraceae bacterium]